LPSKKGKGARLSTKPSKKGQGPVRLRLLTVLRAFHKREGEKEEQKKVSWVLWCSYSFLLVVSPGHLSHLANDFRLPRHGLVEHFSRLGALNHRCQARALIAKKKVRKT
jgi:hypothetical protein